MRKLSLRLVALVALISVCAPAAVRAQDAARPPAVGVQDAAQPQNPAQVPAGTGAPTICGNTVPPPRALPPDGSGPVIYFIAPCFLKQGGAPLVEPETYMYYIKTRGSQPSQGVWVPYDEKAEDTIREDFKRLWGTNFLEDLSIEVSEPAGTPGATSTDYVFSNGVIGKLVTYNMEERERVKIVTYEGSKKLERTKLDEKLKEQGIQLRLDSFLDEGLIRRVKTAVLSMMAEKGYQAAEVTHKVTPVGGGPKLVNVTFNVSEGPKVKIRDVEFIGNKEMSDRALQKKMKENKPKGLLGMFGGGGTYQEAKFEEDADKIIEFYRNQGYITARVGQPEVRVMEDSRDGESRYIQLRIPITEGNRYRIDEFAFDGNTIVKSEALRPLFKVAAGDWYSEKDIRKGLEKARELYGAGGYFEFTGYPDLRPEGVDVAASQVPEALAETAPTTGGTPKVDVIMRMQEGKQYFVNRITFVGNTTTRDNVIRREMRLVEGGVFNTEALKYSVRRINQLGYFKNLEEQSNIQVQKAPTVENQVDVTLKFEEQNRNQLTFGAGVSQWEGVFGQLAFQTANFLGRGETLTLSLQAGERAQNYQLAFTEPFLFDRNITGGFDIFKRKLQYIGYYTQKSSGGNLVFGFPVADFSRMFVNYSYEQVKMTDLNQAFLDPSCIFNPGGCSSISIEDLRDALDSGGNSQISADVANLLRRNPFIYDSLLIGAGGRRTVSKITPSFVHNTVDNPIFPTTGRRYTASMDFAGVGGNTKFYKPRLEGVWFMRHTGRTSVGLRGQFEFIAPYASTTVLPIFEKLYLGGEYSIRGFDIRSVGPSDPDTGLVLGGNKSLLFNGEYLISIAGPVRLVLFYDAGQVVDEGQSFAMNQFRTSTGAEIRFFMPVLNVPFRLIFAKNPQREGVLDNNLRPAKDFVFRFAVGTTF